MNTKKILQGFIISIPLVVSASAALPSDILSDKILKRIRQLPDSIFTTVKQEDLLIDEVYIKLARDGWSQEEIRRIMGQYIKKNRNKVRGSNEYGRYAKQWLPSFGFTPGGDTLYQFIDTTYNEKMLQQVRQKMGRMFDSYYFAEPYTPDDRKNGQRQPGVFRPVLHKPSSGRIHWIHVHPENDDSLIVIPDGGGMFRTHDLGKNWECITDRIPVREHRNTATHSAIPVDPDDWNHIYAFMGNGNPVYETFDGGQNWKRVEGASHKGFKRGYCFRDAEGNLKFIGAQQKGGSSYWESALFISEDTCKTWTQVVVPDSLKDIHPLNAGVKGTWFQQVEFDTQDRNRLYLPTSRSIFYFDDGAKSYTINGKKEYRLKKMDLRVFNQDGSELRSDTTVFPFPGSSQGFLNVNPNNPDQLWFAAGQRSPLETAMYYSPDRGKNWLTYQETTAGIGSGKIYGNEAPWGWLGGFGVNFQDPNWVYGCSMSSAISQDGGRNFQEYAWGHRLKSLHEDGVYYYTSNSRHNADNHCIVSHKSGRVFRGSDGGMLMKDKAINDHQWTQIGGNMGQMLYYRVKVNEFGDQMLIGNTQDIDVQTYRNGRWGSWRGYEGSTCFTNPYANCGYYSGAGGGGLDDMAFGSWSPGTSKADVCNGSWFLLRTDCDASISFFRIDDVGRTPVNLSAKLGLRVNSFALSRQDGNSTVYISCSDNKVYYSTDLGETFTVIEGLTGGKLAADPNNSNLLYIGQTGAVWLYNIQTRQKLPVGMDLPNVACSDLVLHEGSGDLYFLGQSTGLFIKEKDQENWRLWMKGYNTTKFNNIDLNYTTQEMVICDYGRGVFIADLQNPADRYFQNGFPLKEISNHNGRRTIGIDTRWTIPLYYYYEWKVNGVARNNPYQYLTDSLQGGDHVQLKLTLRESPDVSTLSEEFIVEESTSTTFNSIQKNALYSDGSGMVDLGYVDYFFKDFSIDVWVQPLTSGVILCNRQKDWDKGAKGWYLSWEDGTLYFGYAPANLFNQPTYETAITQQTRINGGKVAAGEWSHIVVSQQRDGLITLYVNGKKSGEATRILSDHSLNNSMNLGAFSDGYERVPLKGAIDELKIWNYALSQSEIPHVMFSQLGEHPEGLRYYNGFNESQLSDNKECFSQKAPIIRNRAVTQMQPVSFVTNAQRVATKQLMGKTTFFEEDAQITLSCSSQPIVTLFQYNQEQVTQTPSNLNELYHQIYPRAWHIQNLEEDANNDSLTLEFSLPGIALNGFHRLYVADALQNRNNWQSYQDLNFDTLSGRWVAEHCNTNELKGKILLVVTMQPAIEVQTALMNQQGIVSIYEKSQRNLPIQAKLLCELTEPFEAYQVKSSRTDILNQGTISFTQGEAQTTLPLNTDSLGTFGSITQVTLTGEDEQMIPLTLRIKNQIMDPLSHSSLQIENGGVLVGDASAFEAMQRSNTVTLMGWIRLDQANLLTGVKPILLFRSGGATGIHLDNGNLRCHWNEESWSWNTSTPLQVTTQDLGRWIHVALVARPDGMDYYLNGKRHSISRNLNKASFVSALMLGRNFANDSWFSGAFDQVGLWNRSLSQEEVLKYMHQPVLLNDSALMAYLNMDYRNASGELLENSRLLNINSKGSSIHRSPIPFGPDQIQTEGSKEWSLATLQFPNTQEVSYYLTAFNRLPYHYSLPQRSDYRPIKSRYYALVYPQTNLFADQDSISLTFNEPAALESDQIMVGIRPLGSEYPFEQFVEATRISSGNVLFKVPAVYCKDACEMMLFIQPDANKRPVKGVLHAIRDNHKILLAANDQQIEVEVELTSFNEDDCVLLQVKETDYATVVQDTIALSTKKVRHTIRLNREKLHKTRWNPLTLSLAGATSEPLELQLAFEPKVQLSLKNGIDKYTFVATQPINTLAVEAALVEGILEESIQLKITSDLSHALNTGMGSLLSERNVEWKGLHHYTSDKGSQHEGWNLIGNPYLTNVNLTKHQNVIFNKDELTSFIYRYDTERGNYLVSDMTFYDADATIRPFESFFVKALTDDAKMTITPVAKEQKLSRKTFDHFNATEHLLIRLELSSLEKNYDQTVIQWINGAQDSYEEGEDAPKMWSLSTQANQLYSLTKDVECSINTVSLTQQKIPLGISLASEQVFVFRVAALYGWKESELELVDQHTGTRTPLVLNAEYKFTAESGHRIEDRFSIVVCKSATEISETNTHNYRIMMEDDICTISQLRGNAHIRLFDILGKLICDVQTSKEKYQVRLLSGSYLVQIVENGKTYTTKIRM